MDNRIGKNYFGLWKATEKIGEGSFGSVYKLERNEFGRTYTSALKIINIPQSSAELRNLIDDGYDSERIRKYFNGFVEDLVNEIDLLSKLKGTSNVVSYEDHAVIEYDNGTRWEIQIRMEYLTSLMEHYQKNIVFVSDVIKLGIDICSALEICLKNGIIHRDIKPDNIFVSSNGDYKLGDFGIAKKLDETKGAASRKGALYYMAPEVYKGEYYSSNVDIYSLGIVLYRLLNDNSMPFVSSENKCATYIDREKAMAKRMSGEPLPKPKNADDRLAEIILKACEYNPYKRYSDPSQLKKDLEAVLESEIEKKQPLYSFNNKTKCDDLSKSYDSSNSNDENLDETCCLFGYSQNNNIETKDDTEQQKYYHNEHQCINANPQIEEKIGDIDTDMLTQNTQTTHKKFIIALISFLILALIVSMSLVVKLLLKDKNSNLIVTDFISDEVATKEETTKFDSFENTSETVESSKKETTRFDSTQNSSENTTELNPGVLYRPTRSYFCNQYRAYVFCTDTDVQDFVKMRYGPSKYNYNVVTTIPNYEYVIVESTSVDGWSLCNYKEYEGWIRTKFIFRDDIECENGAGDKPVLYLYPENEMDVDVKVNLKELVLSCTYPEYNDGWSVKAYPDGRLINKKDGREYSYLYWELNGKTNYDFSRGFVVKGEDTLDFLQEILPKIGLMPKEYNEFIVYWLPKMQNNKYNLISFQTKKYTDNVQLEIYPQPESVLRVFMAYMPLEKYIYIPEQKFSGFERKGFSVVEWGGVEVKK